MSGGREARPKVAWRRVDGVVLIDKPSGITSTAALARARRALRAEKGGHTGTLDPLASGLLPLCFGEATKFAADLLEADKRYTATIRLGVETDSGDADGIVVATRPVAADRAAIDAVLVHFRGPIAQVPPMHSALKRDGQPLYKLARQGIVVERAARHVTIHRLDVIEADGDTLIVDVHCSKGTYVRSLAIDIGHRLGCGAHLTALRRTGVGALSIGDAVPLDRFEATAGREASLLPVDTLIAALPRVDLDERQGARFRDGQRLEWAMEAPCRVRVYRAVDDALLGTALVGADGLLAPLRLVARATDGD